MHFIYIRLLHTLKSLKKGQSSPAWKVLHRLPLKEERSQELCSPSDFNQLLDVAMNIYSTKTSKMAAGSKGDLLKDPKSWYPDQRKVRSVVWKVHGWKLKGNLQFSFPGDHKLCWWDDLHLSSNCLEPRLTVVLLMPDPSSAPPMLACAIVPAGGRRRRVSFRERTIHFSLYYSFTAWNKCLGDTVRKSKI